jgi:hypothetical protein
MTGGANRDTENLATNALVSDCRRTLNSTTQVTTGAANKVFENQVATAYQWSFRKTESWITQAMTGDANRDTREQEMSASTSKAEFPRMRVRSKP